jgi:putative transposase
MRTPTYDSDMCNAEWEIIQTVLVFNQGRGRKMQLSPRDIIDAIRYISRTGVQWRYLPKDFPKWQAVYRWMAKWSKDGTWERIQEALQKRVRKDAKGEEKAEEVNTGSVDSQSSKSSGTHEERGFDKGKLVNGRKRHILVDSLGMILAVVVTAASCSDAKGGEILLQKCPSERYPDLKRLFVDSAYNREEFHKLTERRGIKVIIPKKKRKKGWNLQKHRWLVERTFSWLMRNRRLCRSYEHTPKMEESFIRIAMTTVCLRRLANLQSTFFYKRPLKSD